MKLATPEKVQHFVFGYGSLLCPQSRAITVPTLASKLALPILAHHVERTWSARVAGCMTAMGVRFREGAKCAGVLLPVDEIELAKFDDREAGYDRVLLELQNLTKVPFLSEAHHIEDHAVLTGRDHEARVWIYVPKYQIPADPSCPIAQSYVDIILRGCLGISKEFAQSFLETCDGWWWEQQKDEKENDGQHYTWVNDRHSPLYVRADPHYSHKMADKLDRLLQEHLPHAWEKRQVHNSKRLGED